VVDVYGDELVVVVTSESLVADVVVYW
jgi:hypothetical protein